MKLKKILASILCLAMVLSTMSFTVLAADEATELPAAVNGVITLTEDVRLPKDTRYSVPMEINLAGHTLYVTSCVTFNADTTIYGGTINADGQYSADGIIRANYHYGSPVALTLKNVTVSALNSEYSTGVFYLHTADDTLTLDDVDVRVSGDGDPGSGVFYSPSSFNRGTVILTNGTTVEADAVTAVFFATEVDIDNTTITCAVTRPVFRQAAGTVENTTVTVTSIESGRAVIEDVAGQNSGVVVFANNSTITAPEGTIIASFNNNGSAAIADSTSDLGDSSGVSSAVAKVGETYYASLQAAVNAAEGDTTINIIASEINDDVTIPQKEGVNITIEGNDAVFTGTIYIHGNARHTGAETLNIKDINFVTDKASHDFISSNSTGSVERYAHNVTIEGCTFTATADDNEVVATRFRQAYNIKMIDCDTDGLHSAMWATGVAGIEFDDVVTTDTLNGISVGTSNNVVVKNSQITAVGEGAYAIRADGSGAYSLTVEDSELNAFAPILVRNTTDAGYKLSVEDTELVATNSDGRAIIVSGADYDANKPYQEPPVEITTTLTGEISGVVADVDGAYFANIQKAVAASKENSIITVYGDINEDIEITKNGVTLMGVLSNAQIATFSNGGTAKMVTAADKADYATAIYGSIDARAAKDVVIRDLYVNANGNDAISIKDGLVENVMIDNAWKAFVLSYAGAGDHVDIRNCTTIDAGYIAHNDEANATTTYTFENNYFHSSFGITMGKSGLITVVGNTMVHDSESYPYYSYGILRHFAAPMKAYENTLIGVKYSKRVAESDAEVYNNYFSLGIENAQETSNTIDIPTYYLDKDRTMLYIEEKNLVDGPVADRAHIYFSEEPVETGDDYAVYEMAIEADDDAILNLVSAQMNITLDAQAVEANGMAVSYEVMGANDFVVSQDPATGKYLFNLPEGTNQTIGNKSGEKVVIGRVKLTGFTHKVNEPEVKATVNVTDGFYNYKDINNSLAKLEKPITDSSFEHSLTVASKKLTINITFPNAVKDNAVAYQDMKVTISGADLDAPIVADLGGTDSENISYKVEKMLTKDRAYTVTVEGAGYRTARYTVTMTNDKTLNFWNNVEDVAKVIETDATSGAVTKNFLAGDIVKDNNINIYDLSAVVSYFGTSTDKVNKSDYAKYDLNRDGVIDSKDVAYVLVSWNE